MAEAIAVISFISAVASLTNYGKIVVKRLNDFRSNVRDLPGVFLYIGHQLPLLITTVDKIYERAKNGDIDVETEAALRPVVDGVQEQLRELDVVLVKVLPSAKASTWGKGIKALKSPGYEKTVREIASVIDRYALNLTAYQTVSNGNLIAKLTQRISFDQHPPIQVMPVKTACFMLRYESDNDFLGQEHRMAEIERRFETDSRVALAGIGGVGKSRIAIEYCHRHRSQSPDDHVFWVHCGNAARFGLIYQDIARTLELPGFDDPKTNTVHLVSEWLSNESNGSWLMVLDNANDATIWIRSDNERESQQIHQEQAVPLAEYVPRGKHGRVLITTRDSQLGKALANSKKKPIEIAPLRPEDAETLLRRKIPEDDQVTEGDAAEITKTLDYLPLAITQAAAYLDKMDMAVAEYLDLLKMGKAGSFDLLRPDAHDPGRDYEIQNSVFSTWKISFDLISRQAPRAAGLLSLMAMFDRQAILDSLLRLDGESELDFIAAIQKLKAFSLITEETKASIFSMHPSVQLSIQKWLEHLGELSKWQEVSLSALANCCPPSGEYEHWGSVEALYPHFELILKHPLDSDISQLKRATILHVLGCYKNARGQHSVAYTYCSESRITRERLLGVTHAETLISVNEQAITLGNIGQNEEAEVVFRRVFDVRKEALGPIHQQTMISMNNLANSMLRNGRHREVRAMLEQVLDTGRGTVDAEDPNTLTSISLLAMCLSKNRCYGCHTKAGVMLRQVFIISSKVLPPLHPYTLDSMSDLAGFLASYGFYQEHAFVMRKKGRGLKLPNTLPDISASEFRKKRRGEIRQAESMYRTVLTGQEIKLGVDHMATLETVHGLADVLDSLHCFEEASALYQRGVLGFTNTLGSEHDATKRCLNCQMRMLAHMERGCAWQDGDCQDGGSQDGDSQDGDSQDGYSQDGGSQDEDIQNEESQYDAKTKGASLGQISELGQTGTSRSQSRSHYFASADGEYNIISLDTATNREESSAESIDHYALLEKPQPIDASQSQTPFCRSESDLQHPSHPMATVRRLSSPS